MEKEEESEKRNRGNTIIGAGEREVLKLLPELVPRKRNHVKSRNLEMRQNFGKRPENSKSAGIAKMRQNL